MNKQVTIANLAALDAALDAVQQPKMMVVSRWWFEFWQADKRKRGRLIRQARRKIKLEKNGINTDLSVFVELKDGKYYATVACGLNDKTEGQTICLKYLKSKIR